MKPNLCHMVMQNVPMCIRSQQLLFKPQFSGFRKVNKYMWARPRAHTDAFSWLGMW